MSRFSVLRLAMVLWSAALLAGCGSSGGSSSVESAPTTLSGTASKGPISSGVVTAYSVVNGIKSAALGTVQTDSLGHYSVDIGSYSGPVLLEVVGGTYKDEATGIVTVLASRLRTAVPNAAGAMSAHISALTEAAVQNASAAAGGLTATNMQMENDRIKTQLGFDPVLTEPADASSVASAGAVKEAKAYAMYLGSMSQYIQNNPGATPASAAGDFAASFKSGGLQTNAAIKQAVDDFGGNANNKTGVAGMTNLANLIAGGSSVAADPVIQPPETQPAGFAQPTIVFDYSYDTNGFFTPARRALMEAAAAVFTSRISATAWTRVDPTQSGGHYDLAFFDPSTMALSWRTDVVIPENQITIYLGATDFTKAPVAMMQTSEGDGATQLLSIRNVSGGVASVLTSASQFRPIDATITFDLQGVQGFSSAITRQWHFDSDGNLATDDRDKADPHYGDYSNIYDTAIHELGHVMGIYHPLVYGSFLESDSNFGLAYTSRVQAAGDGFVFTGTYAKQMYYNHVGENVPLDTATKSHFADGVRSQTADGWISVSYDRNQPFRKTFSELEFQALRDMGYTISPKP